MQESEDEERPRRSARSTKKHKRIINRHRKVAEERMRKKRGRKPKEVDLSDIPTLELASDISGKCAAIAHAYMYDNLLS